MPLDLDRPGLRLVVVFVVDVKDGAYHVRVHAIGVPCEAGAPPVDAHPVGRRRAQGPRLGGPLLVQRLELPEEARLAVVHELRGRLAVDALQLPAPTHFLARPLFEPVEQFLAHLCVELRRRVHHVEAQPREVSNAPHLSVLDPVVESLLVVVEVVDLERPRLLPLSVGRRLPGEGPLPPSFVSELEALRFAQLAPTVGKSDMRRAVERGFSELGASGASGRERECEPNGH
mmetsp:Transcript_7122/g.16288  ORF Transcript_7122/g.16288 Transcript_7122/m.16288 type:complete len:231 (-) Transcript_7122:17-709(-)